MFSRRLIPWALSSKRIWPCESVWKVRQAIAFDIDFLRPPQYAALRTPRVPRGDDHSSGVARWRASPIIPLNWPDSMDATVCRTAGWRRQQHLRSESPVKQARILGYTDKRPYIRFLAWFAPFSSTNGLQLPKRFASLYLASLPVANVVELVSTRACTG